MRPLRDLHRSSWSAFIRLLAVTALLSGCSDDATPGDGTGGSAGSSGHGGAAGSGGVDDSGADIRDAARDGAGGSGAAGSDAGIADSARGGGAGTSATDSGRGGGAGAGGADSGRDGAGPIDSGADRVDGADTGAGGGGGVGGADSGGDAAAPDGGGDANAPDGEADADSGTDGGGSDGNDGSGDDSGPIAAGVRWIGRVDTSDSRGPRFSWSGTGFAAQFTGTSIGVNLANDDAYFFQAVVDGVKSTRFQAAKGQATQNVVSGLAAGTHTLELYRETEGFYGTSQLLGITEATLLAPPPAPARRIEFVGDSMSAGYGNLGSEPHPNYTDPSPCTFSFDTESAYMSYGAVTARALGAEASLIAVSGWGLLRSRTSDTSEVLPNVYSNTLEASASPVWDFHVEPQAVVINLGTNDFVPGDPGTDFTTALTSFIDTIRAKYPSAWIFCAVGTMYTTAEASQATTYVQAAVTSRGGDAGKVAFVDLGSQDALLGTGCDWHPNVTEDQSMADTLATLMRTKLGW